MLEWLSVLIEPVVTGTYKYEPLKSAEIRHNELIALMTNMMEVEYNGI